MVSTLSDLHELRTYSLDEIDEQLKALNYIIIHSKICDKDRVRKQIDLWLERRFEATNGA